MFLKDLAQRLYANFGNKLAEVSIVFPNRRAGLFFRKDLAEVIDQPVWAPEILSIESFVNQFSTLQVADRLTLIFMLYEEYKKLNSHLENFDRFYSWGEILLKDFEDIDRYLINPDHLFTSLKEQKELESRFDYLTEEQKEVIRSFWSSFGEKLSAQQKGFLDVWETLPKVYHNFTSTLKNQNLAYEGMIFRQIAYKALASKKSMSTADFSSPKKKKYIFAGFNALSASEEVILKYFVEFQGAEVFWDVDKSYLEDPSAEAGLYFRKYKKDKVLAKTFRDPLPSYLDDSSKKLEIIGVPLAVGQAKKLGEMLNYIKEKSLTPLRTNTVVVLPEEHLLFPVLHSLPHEIEDINVTMGYPLKETALYGFLEHLIHFQQVMITDNTGQPLFHHKSLLAILRHPLFQQHSGDLSRSLVHKIEKQNHIYFTKSGLDIQEEFSQSIFKKVSGGNELIDYLIQILMNIDVKEGNIREKATSNESEAEDEKLESLEKEFIYHFYTLLNRLKEIITTQKVELNITTFSRLFRQMINTAKLPFSGEPLKGLQIMGALETRNLDFENVIILSMNEGAFPGKGTSNSYIPFNLRKGFGLPSVDQQDAIYAYTFYRLMHHAKNIYLLYNTEVGKNMNGEMSRYLFQLLYETNYEIKTSLLSNSVKPQSTKPITVFKNREILDILQKYVLVNGEATRRLAPSALNIYLDCRLKFYYRYILNLQEPDKIQDKIDPMIFGNVLHLVMEYLYKDFMEKTGRTEILETDFEGLKKEVEDALNKAFLNYFFEENGKAYSFEGGDIIAAEIIIKFAYKILEHDKKYAPFQILGLEANEKDGYYYNVPVELEGTNFEVGLKGIIDRIDLKEGVLRVLDYKTGKDKKDVESIDSLFDRDDKNRNKAAMQTLIYGLLFNEKYPDAPYSIMPGIYNSKQLFSDDFDVRLRIKPVDQKHFQPLNNIIPYLDDIKKGIQQLFAEIYNSEIPFDQTDDLKKCGYCPYSGICHR